MPSRKAFLNRPHGAHRVPTRRVALRWAGLAVLGAGLAVPPPAALAHVPANAPSVAAATYATQIQYGGPDAPWHNDAALQILLQSRKATVSRSTAPATGTTVSWSSPNGNGTITFFDNGDDFLGSAQFPGEGPVGYRGTRQVKAISTARAASYATEIQYGGPEAPWHRDAGLSILLRNRRTIVSRSATPATGTTVTWDGPSGNGSITFFNDDDDFRGSAQFTGEGPVGYRGQRG